MKRSRGGRAAAGGGAGGEKLQLSTCLYNGLSSIPKYAAWVSGPPILPSEEKRTVLTPTNSATQSCGGTGSETPSQRGHKEQLLLLRYHPQTAPRCCNSPSNSPSSSSFSPSRAGAAAPTLQLLQQQPLQ